MTALPPHDSVPNLTVVCDGCGSSSTAADLSSDHRAAWMLLWLRATGDGWTGNSRAIGPHYCPGCSS